MSTQDRVVEAYRRASQLAAERRWQDVRSTLRSVGDGLAALPQAVHLLARACSILHDPEPALVHAREALALFRRQGDEAGEVEALNLLGIIHFEVGDLDAAHREFTAALAAVERLGQSLKLAQIHNNLGSLCNLQERPAEAREHYARALELFRDLEEPLGQSQTLHNLGITARDLAESEQAEEFFTRAAEAALQAGDIRMLAVSTVARAELVLGRGDAEGAERMARAALMRFDAHSSLLGLAEVHRVLGTIARARGHADRARTHYDQALEYCALHANPLLEAETRLERGTLFQERGEREAARADLAAAAEAFERLHARRQAAEARSRLAEGQSSAPPA